MISRGRLWIAIVLAGSLIAIPGCAGPKRDPDVDFKLTNTAYMEEGDLVAFVVSVRAALQREDSNYVPFQIAIMNKGLTGLTVNREFFELIDEDGKRYAPVGFEELRQGYGSTDLDRRLGDIEGVIENKYQTYEQQPSTLTPSFDRPTLLVTKLPRFSYLVDWLYFPMPEGGIKERRFELFLNAPELPDPVFVRFRVTG